MVSGLIRATMLEISEFIRRSIDLIDDNQVSKMIEELVDAYERGARILVMGAGRSGLVGRAFAMRLLHLGYQVAVLGETIIPRIRENDLVMALSGSGRTRLIVTAAEAAKHVGARIIAVTSYPDSPLAKLADIIVVVPGRTKIALGTLFEDTLLVFLDGISVELMRRLGKTEEDLRNVHANIEL